MKTRTELINATLERLGAIARGAVPSAEDVAKVNAYIEPVLADLNARNIAWELSPDSIADEVFLHLVPIMANALKDDFGLSGAEWDRMQASGEMGERKLKTVASAVQRKPNKMEFSREIGPFPRTVTGTYGDFESGT